MKLYQIILKEGKNFFVNESTAKMAKKLIFRHIEEIKRAKLHLENTYYINVINHKAKCPFCGVVINMYSETRECPHIVEGVCIDDDKEIWQAIFEK